VLDGHLVEKNGENTLLHLTSILGAQDDNLLLGEVDGHRGGGSHALRPSVGREGSGVVDDIVGVEVRMLLSTGADKHIPHEQGMVSTGTDDANADSVALIPASEAVDDIDAIPSVQVINSTLSVDSPDLWAHGLVNGSPPNIIL